MSNTNGFATLTKSMNGIITISDGSGTTISDGTITTDTANVNNLNVDNLNVQNIVAPDPTATSNIFNANTDDVNIGANCSQLRLKDLYTLTTGGYQLLETYEPTIPFVFMSNNTASITLGSNTSPLIGEYTCINDNELANKGYVDSVVSGGGVSLSANNIFTGINTFDNNTIIGKTNYTSDISINASIFNIVANELICQSLDNSLFVQPYCKFTNGGFNQNMILETSTSGKITQNYSTNTASTAVVTGRIMVEGGDTTTYSGDMTLDAKNINLNSSSFTFDAGIASSVNFFFKIAGVVTSLMMFSGGTTTYNGVMAFLTGSYSLACQTIIRMASPLFTFENGASTTAMDIDIGVAGTLGLEFRTNSTIPTNITSSIVASGGTTTNTGNITINAGNLILNTPIKGDVTFDAGILTSVALFFKIAGVATSKMVFSGGTTTYNGVMAFLTGSYNIACQTVVNMNSPLVTIENTASTTALDFNNNVAGTLGLEFRTNTANPTRITSSIVASGQTASNSGTMTLTNGTLNINSSIGTDFNNNRVRLTATSSLYGDTSGSAEYLPLFDGNCFTQITANTTLTMSSVARESMYVIPYGTTTSFTITLNTSATRDSATFHIYNFGTGTITVFGGSGRMFGEGYALGGQVSIGLGSGVGRSFRCCVRIGGIGNQNNNTTGWYVH